MNSTVLITTANTPPKNLPFLEMENTVVRHITAKAAVLFWAAQQVEQIVIADATGGTLLNTDEVLQLQKIGVEVEQISYLQNTDAIVSHGKGYGEGQLLKFALENSILLRNATHFFKCTGKVYCRNFESIVQLISENNIQNIFWKYFYNGDTSKPWADMRFFYTTKKFFEENIIPAYLNSDDKVAAAESHCFNALSASLREAKAIRPLLSGFEGGTGKQYFDMSFGFLDFNCPCWAST